ncbi:MAG: hypothetical protein EOO92_15430 [Pedobacter sp.]|nr:MAG: hypothetical protein EOO92_15430 [Pedobacter sp.]
MGISYIRGLYKSGMLKFPLFIVAFLLCIATGCKKKIDIPMKDNADKHLVSATSLAKLTKAEMVQRANIIQLSFLSSNVNYDTEFFKIVYRTVFKGDTIEASGLIGIPTNGPLQPSIISAQNVTRFTDSSAPSNFPNSTTGYELLAAMGYVSIIPDYIGFGSSRDISSPYYVSEYTASPVVDMIKASKEFLASRKFGTSNRLFLIGYSAGGFATLSALREIETNPVHKLSVTAAMAGAGGFDLTTTVNAFLNKEAPFAPTDYAAYVIHSYNKTYRWNRPWSDFFTPEYSNRIAQLFETGDHPNLPGDVARVFNPTFLQNLRTDGREVAFKTALRDNSFLDWYPKTNTRLYHSLTDELIPYESTQTVFNSFKSKGANVAMVQVSGGHELAIQGMIVDALPWIQSIDK